MLGLSNARHVGDVTVTFLALNAAPDVTFVRKINIVGKICDLYPGDRFLTVPILLNLSYFRTIRAHGSMAAHASLNTRDPRHFGFACVYVAKDARDGIVAGMFFVAEINWLFGGRIGNNISNQRLAARNKRKTRAR